VSIKISVADAAERYGVTKRTIFRWVAKYDVYRFPNGTYDRDQLDSLNDNYGQVEYMNVQWEKAACKNLPTHFFYKIEDRGVSKLIDVDVFRFTCAPCPIWQQCLRYASNNEDYGVWGGMTSEERRAVLDWRDSVIKQKVFADFEHYGISQEMILQAIGK